MLPRQWKYVSLTLGGRAAEFLAILQLTDFQLPRSRAQSRHCRSQGSTDS